MIRPRRDFLIAFTICLIGFFVVTVAALAPGALETSAPRQLGLMIGGLAVLFGALMSVNFWRAVQLARRIERGEGVIDAWTVQPAEMRMFLAAEAKLDGPRNLWRAPKDAGQRPVALAFGPEVVVIDGAMHSIPSAGMQAMRGVKLRPWTPPMLEFTTHLVATRPGVTGGLTTIKSLLRVPAPDLQQAEKLRSYYQGILDGKTIIQPERWAVRIRIGVWGILFGLVGGLTGYFMAEAAGWRADDNFGLAALVLMIAGPLVALGGLMLALIAVRLRQTQHGGG